MAMDDLHDETSDLAAHVADELASANTLHIGDVVAILPEAAFARLGLTGQHGRGVIESIVTDTTPDPQRGPLYHIRLTEPGASGWLGTGYSRNYADELASADGGQPAPLSDERLAEIREALHDRSNYSESFGIIDTADMGLELLDEVTQRREREAALLAERERLLADNESLRAELVREHEDRVREYEFATVDDEMRSKRIRELRKDNERLLAVVRAVDRSADGRMLMCMCGVAMPTTIYQPGVMIRDETPVAHHPTCVFAQARAALAAAETGEKE